MTGNVASLCFRQSGYTPSLRRYAAIPVKQILRMVFEPYGGKILRTLPDLGVLFCQLAVNSPEELPTVRV